MFLLDTNVISELRKQGRGRADRNVVAWATAASAPSMFISVITVEELEIGVLRTERRDALQGQNLRRWLERNVLPAFADRVLPVDTAIARRSASLNVPDSRPARDSLIAATALVHGMSVVTRNVADFARTRVDVVDPWRAPA